MNAVIEASHARILSGSVLAGPQEAIAVVEGQIPTWLRGTLMRTAPAVFIAGQWQAQHWFDGLGQVYAFRIGEQGKVRWSQRLVDSEYSRQVHAGHVTLASFGSGNDRRWYERLAEPVPRPTDNANVSVWPTGSNWVAMTETDRSLTIDASTLATLGDVRHDDELPPGLLTTAHPQSDPASGRIFNIGAAAGLRPQLVAFEQAPRGPRVEIGRWSTPRLPYLHSFGLSAAHLVMIAHPFDVAPTRLLFSNRFVEHFEWHRDQETRLVVMRREDGSVRVVSCEPMFVFHTVQQFEVGDTVVLDLLAYPDASTLTQAMRLRALAKGVPPLRPTLTRLHIGPRGVKSERLCDEGFEFPSADRRGRNRRDGAPAVWGAAIEGLCGQERSRIVRADLRGGGVKTFGDDEHLYGEPVYVGRPGAPGEGLLLTVGASMQRQRTRLAMLDPDTLAPVATATIDAAVPLGFHGSFRHDDAAVTI